MCQNRVSAGVEQEDGAGSAERGTEQPEGEARRLRRGLWAAAASWGAAEGLPRRDPRLRCCADPRAGPVLSPAQS